MFRLLGAPFFPFGICGLISLLGILAIVAALVLLRRDRVKMYHMLTARPQHWFPVEYGPILVDRNGKRPIAWLEIALADLKSTVVLRPKDALFQQYVAKTVDTTIELPPGSIQSVCVYGKHVIALRPEQGDAMALWGKAEFESDLTPPDPKVVRSLRRRLIIMRGILLSAAPIAFFGLIWLFSGLFLT